MPDTVQLVDPEGRSHDVPLSDVAGLLNQNWHQRTTADTSRLAGEAAQEADYGGVGGTAKAIGYAGARGLTLGLSDVAARAAGKPAESLRGLEEAHPTATGVAEFAGALAPSLIAPETLAGRAAARTPAALVSGIGKTILHSAEQEGAGLAGRAVAGTVGAAAEGALYGGGAYLSQVALEDKPLAAEGFAAAMGKGALWGAPIGGALVIGERALVRAKSLFPRFEVTREAARAVNNEASSAIATSLRDGDLMLDAARRRISAADAQVGKAKSTETMQRAVFGDAQPQTAVDQLAAGHEKQQLVEAVQEYTQSKAALEDWARLEADPDLEAALLRIRAPDVQVGAPRLRTPEFGEVVPGQTTSPELGEFGLERTSVGKGLAKGTPVSEMPPLPMREPPAGLPELPRAEPVASMSPDATNIGRRPVAKGTEPGTATSGPRWLPDDEFETLASKWRSDLSDDAEKALQTYSRNGTYGVINAPLRRGGGNLSDVPEHLQPLVGKIDEAVAAAPAPHEIMASRGLHDQVAIDQWADVRPGDSIVDHGFGSMSSSREVGQGYAKGFGTRPGVELVVSIPKGYPAAPVPSAIFGSERELLLPRNTKYTVTSVENVQGGAKVIHVAASAAQKGEASKVAAIASAPTDINQMTLKQLDRHMDELDELRKSLDRPGTRDGAEMSKVRADLDAADARYRDIKSGKVPEPRGTQAQSGGGGHFTPTERPAGGTQGGKWYRDESGQQWFGKSYRGDTDRLEGEHVANEIYRMFGIDAPETRIATFDGKPMLMSKEVPGEIGTAADIAATNAKDGFVIDAWLANHDVVGTGYDNILIDGSKATRIDNGGATIWRARGEPKELKAIVDELQSMRDPKRFAGRAFAGLTDGELQDQVRRFAGDYPKLKPEIERLIDSSGLSTEAKAKIKIGLNDRAEWLIKQAKPVQTESSAAHTIASEDEFRKVQAQLREKLTTDEIKQALRYSREYYLDVNRALRGAEKVLDPEAAAEITPVMDRVLGKAAIDEPLTVHRAIGSKPGSARYNLQPGDTIYDPAFGSTSYRSENINRFGDVHFVITAPRGTRIAAIPSSKTEGELTLARGTTMRIDRRMEHADGKVTLHATVIKQDGNPELAVTHAPKETTSTLPTTTLTGQLRGTQAQLEGGAALKDIGAPARAEYASTKAERTTAAAEKYRAEAIAKQDVPEYATIKAHESKADDYLEQTLPARRIADRGYYEPPGGGADKVATEKAQKAIKEGQREAIKLNVAQDGKITVTDGRHRLAAAIEADAPIKVKWSTGTGPVPSDVLRGGPKTTQRLDLKDLGLDFDPAKRSYFGTTEALTPPAVSEMGVGLAPRVESAEVKTAVKTHPGMSRAEYRESHAAGRREVAETIVDRTLKPEMQRVVDEDAIAKALRKRNGKDVNIGADLNRAAKVINDHEAAAAKLTDALGTDAPATAVAQAKAYRQALAQHSETAANSTAKAASDLNTKVAPAAAGGQTTVVDDAVVKALRKHDAATARNAERAIAALEREAVAAASPAAAAKDTGAAVPKKRTAIGTALGVAADVGTAIEVLNAMGVHTPDLSKIPVIGPVLSMYLKARAVMGILGRRGGSIGRSAESVIASKSAAVRDRINAAAQAALDIGATAARKAAPIAGPAGALAYRLFPGDGDTKSKNPAVLYQARMTELARAAEPGAIDRAVGDRVHTSDPDLHDAIVAQTERAVQFLSSKAPRAGLLQSAVPSDGKWHPSRAALEEFAKYVAAVHDPAGVLEDLAHGHPSREGAETLRAVYPALFAQAQRTLLARASEIQHTLPYARRVSISLMYRVPVDLTMSPEHLRYLQPPEPPPGAAGAPGGGGPAGPPPAPPALAGPLQLGQQTLTSLERRAGA